MTLRRTRARHLKRAALLVLALVLLTPRFDLPDGPSLAAALFQAATPGPVREG